MRRKHASKSSAHYGTVESELCSLTPHFRRFQAMIEGALQDGEEGWYRISVHVQHGKAVGTQIGHQSDWDLRKLMGES